MMTRIRNSRKGCVKFNVQAGFSHVHMSQMCQCLKLNSLSWFYESVNDVICKSMKLSWIGKWKSQNSIEIQLQKGVGPIVPQLRSINCSSRLRLWGRPNLGATLWPEILTFSNFEAFLSEFYALKLLPGDFTISNLRITFFGILDQNSFEKNPSCFWITVLNCSHSSSSVVAKHSEQEQTNLFKNVVVNLHSTLK